MRRITAVRLLRRALASILFILSAGILFGQIDTGDPDQVTMELPLEAWVDNGRRTTRHMVDARVINLSRLQSLSSAALMPVLEPSLSPEIVGRLSEVEWIPVEDLVARGIQVNYNSGELRVSITVPAALQPMETVPIQRGAGLPDYPVQPPATVHAALPLYLTGDYQELAGATETSYGIETLPAVGVGDWLLEGEVRLAAAVPDAPGVDDWEARLIRDFPDSQLRWSAGHIITESRGFQSAPETLGSSLETDRDIGSGAHHSTRYVSRFEVENPSEARVYVNGTLVRIMELEPGNYELSDFPLVPGNNQILIELTDSYGQTRRIDGSVAFAGTLLELGERQFGVAAGVYKDEYERPLGRGYYRHGVGRTVTVGAYGEGDLDTQLAGGEVALAGFTGVYELTVAGSLRDGGSPGFAGRLRYSLPTPDRIWAPSLSLQGEYNSPEFLRVGATPLDQGLWKVGATLNQTLPLRSSLLLGANQSFLADGDRNTSLFAGLSKQFGATTSLRISGSMTLKEDIEQWGVEITLVSRPFGPRQSYTAGYDVDENEADVGAYYSADTGRSQGSAGLRANNIDMEEGIVGGLSGSLRGQAPPGDAYLGASYVPAGTDRSGGSHELFLRGRVGSALYFADGLLGVARPSTGSFVLVGKTPALADGNLLVNPARGSGEAETGLFGAAVIPALASYSARPLEIEVDGIPIDYALGPTAYVVETGYRTGTAIRIDGGPLLYGSGSLLDADGEPLALHVFGLRRSGEEELLMSSFTDEEGVFMLYDLQPGTYEIVLPGNSSATVELTLAGGTESPVDLGELKLREASP